MASSRFENWYPCNSRVIYEIYLSPTKNTSNSKKEALTGHPARSYSDLLLYLRCVFFSQQVVRNQGRATEQIRSWITFRAPHSPLYPIKRPQRTMLNTSTSTIPRPTITRIDFSSQLSSKLSSASSCEDIITSLGAHGVVYMLNFGEMTRKFLHDCFYLKCTYPDQRSNRAVPNT